MFTGQKISKALGAMFVFCWFSGEAFVGEGGLLGKAEHRYEGLPYDPQGSEADLRTLGGGAGPDRGACGDAAEHAEKRVAGSSPFRC